MAGFFLVGSFLGMALYAAALFAGHFASSLANPVFFHLLLGLGSALALTSLHCLVFAIFTGSGKDTRLLVEDLGLNSEWVKKTKKFKRTVFPPALYACFWVLLTASLGGMVGAHGAYWMKWIHLGVAWYTFFYNIKVLRLETLAIRENASIMAKVNSEARQTISTSSEPIEVDTIPSDIEWGTHTYALGKFLCFLGFNVWLPYIYIRYIMALIQTPFLPFLALSVALLLGGYYLRWRYQAFRPIRDRPVAA